MERRLQTLRTSLISLSAVFALAFLPAHRSYAQTPSQKDSLRIQVWSELDPFPGRFEDDGEKPVVSEEDFNNNEKSGGRSAENITGDKSEKSLQAEAVERDISIFRFAIDRAKEIGPFLVNGMINGWAFDYVPYDKTRRVAEFFEFEELGKLDARVNPIFYREPLPKENKLLVWVECERTEVQRLAFERWRSIRHPKVSGHGQAPVEDGFEGIKKACSEALKNAVREYWRTQTKNKPKEIFGKVLLIQNPRIYIFEGQYVVDLDFFLETDKIVMYSNY
jgi:hypothetical protein